MHAGIIGDADDDVELRLTQGERSFNQFRALTSSAAAKGNPDEILRRLKLYVKARDEQTGKLKTIEGLVNRRRAEAEMFLA
jgi:GH24 family phage-related lysozyme (muramidase)